MCEFAEADGAEWAAPTPPSSGVTKTRSGAFRVGAGRSAHPVKTEELKRMGRRSPYAHRVRGREASRGARAHALSQTSVTAPPRGAGSSKGVEENTARPTAKNHLIESPMSKGNNKQKYTRINMYI